MAKFSIIDATTGAVKYSGTPKYTGSYCKVSVLEFTEISSPTPINWKVGDYVVYNGTGRTGLTYRLYDIPQPKKRAKNTLYGGAFVYSNVQFFPDTKLLEIEPFRDLVPADNDIHFTTQASWSVWTNAANLIDRFNAVMNTAYPGKWEFRLVDTDVEDPTPEIEALHKLLHDTWFDFTISGENVLQGLTKLYDLCGNIGWVHSVELDDDDNPVNIITVGIPPIYTEGIGSITDIYRYGIGQGLTEIRKSTTNRNELKTRLFAYGSTRNMIPRHYNNLTPAIKDAGSVYIPNLMLPLSKWGTTEVDGVEKKDASKAYIDKNVALYGLRPETVYFDGSNGQKEIYPSLEETTIGELYDVMASGATYRPNLSKHGRSVRLDEIEAVSGIVDDGQRSTDGEKYYTSQTIQVESKTETHSEDFSMLLFSDITCSYSGYITIPLQDIVAGNIDGEMPLNTIACKVFVSIGGKGYESAGKIYSENNELRFSFSSVAAPCNAGDIISAAIVCIAPGIFPMPATSFFVRATTLNCRFSVSKTNEFTIRIPQIGFDISTRARLGSQGLATISMKDGKCGGRSFVVKSVKYNSTYDSWELTLYRGLDESLDILFPNTTYPIASGDHFVLLDIAMPDTYIGMAELKLLDAANALLNDISVPKPFYEPLIDAKYMLDNGRSLLEGQYMRLSDSDITDGTEYVLIDTLVISEGESNIPTYKVTLREQKKVEYSNSQSSGSQLTSLASGANVDASSGGLTPAQKTLLANLDSWFGQDGDGNIFVKKDSEGNERNFYAFGEITAGGVGSGGGGGVNHLYMLEDVPDYRTTYRGKYLRAKTDGSGVEWVDVTGGVSSVISLTGDITQSQLRTALGLGSAAYTESSAYATATQGSHADTAYGWGNHANAGYATQTWVKGSIPALVTAGGRVYNSGDDEGIIISKASNGYAGLILGSPSGVRSVFYLSTGNPFWRYNNGTTTYDISHPAKSGTIALTSDIPTNNNQLTNGAGYITSSGSCAYASNAGNASTLGNHSASYFATASSLGNYLPLSGGTMTGQLLISGPLGQPLNINRTNGTNIMILFSASETEYGRLGFNGLNSPCFRHTSGNYYDLYHEGNLTQSRVTDLIGSTTYAPYNANGYLPLTGGILSGALYFENNVGIGAYNTSRDGLYALLKLNDNNDCIISATLGNTYIRSSASTSLYHRKGTTDYTIYDSGNSNLTTVDWKAKSLTLAGAISGATSISASGVLSADTIRITSTDAVAHLTFSRENANYIIVPPTGNVYFGAAAGSVYCYLGIDSTKIFPRNGNYSLTLGSSDYRWSAIYGVSENLSGSLTVGGSTTISGDISAATATFSSSGINALTLNRAHTSNGVAIVFKNNTEQLGRFICYASVIVSPEFRWENRAGTVIATLDQSGNFVANGEVTAGGSSDIRFKNNVRPYKNAIKKIMSLRPVEFDWNDLATSLYSANKGHSFGLVAQEVQSVIPEVVSPIFEEYLRVDYGKLSTLCIAGLQEHEDRIAILERENKELKLEIQRLKTAC